MRKPATLSVLVASAALAFGVGSASAADADTQAPKAKPKINKLSLSQISCLDTHHKKIFNLMQDLNS